jgi:hypothetical protein
MDALWWSETLVFSVAVVALVLLAPPRRQINLIVVSVCICIVVAIRVLFLTILH